MTGQRVELYKQLPLKTPFSVHVFPIYACNFKCKYCLYGMSEQALADKNFKKEIMTFETFKKAIDHIKMFDDKLKALIFAGHGEPLLHKDICKMVNYAVKAEIAGRVEIVTNASLLNKDMARALIDAGLNRLRISIQGTTALKYREISNYDLDFDLFLSNLKFFFENRKKTEVHIKIIDLGLDSPQDQARFKRLFAPLADAVYIEYAIPFIKEIKASVYNKEFDRCKQGHREKSDICSMPFYMQVVTPNGDILPCCSTDIPIVLGNLHNNSLPEIWNSQATNSFFKMMLTNKDKNHICKSCCVPDYGLQSGDYLDGHQNELFRKYEAKNESGH